MCSPKGYSVSTTSKHWSDTITNSNASPIRLTRLVSESLELLSPRIEATGADIRVDVESISIIGDRSRLQEIFLNLLENSLKFCRSEAAPTVVVSAACHDEVVLCSISRR